LDEQERPLWSTRFCLEQVDFSRLDLTIEVQKRPASRHWRSPKLDWSKSLLAKHLRGSDRADIQVGDRGLKALLPIRPRCDPGALKQRGDNVGHHSSLAPSIAAVPENSCPNTEAQT